MRPIFLVSSRAHSRHGVKTAPSLALHFLNSARLFAIDMATSLRFSKPAEHRARLSRDNSRERLGPHPPRVRQPIRHHAHARAGTEQT